MTMPNTFFPNGGEREKPSVSARLDGELLISSNPFPYYMLVALEAGGPLRALVLLILSPLLHFLRLTSFDSVALCIMTFISTAGLRAADVKAVAKATLPRFYLSDLSDAAYRAFSGFKGEKLVLSSNPRIMVEPFLREYLDVDHVFAAEIRMVGDRYSGLVAKPSAMAEEMKLMINCMELHVAPRGEKDRPLPRKDYPKPLMFHDGRLVLRPTPLNCMLVVLWLPLGVALAIIRILVGVLLPYRVGLLGCAATGVRIRAKFHDQEASMKRRTAGTMYVCSHRTLLDPVFVSTALKKRVTAVTYSVSRFSEVISPIPTVRLSRERARDERAMRAVLDGGDLVVCPEGTTCREPYLLRFSPLFAEIADEVAPVAVEAEGSLFFGTTVRGYKCLDSFFFLMNPMPGYRLEFLETVVVGGRSRYDVANEIQSSIGEVLGFECTNLRRRDKYRMLAGKDGI